MSFDPHLEIGEVVTNDKINEIFGVDKQQGIRTSKKHNYIVIVSKNFNGQYDDQWKDDYLIYYTGVGQSGDQTIEKGRNKTLANANNDHKEIFFFESEKAGEYVYRGLCDLVGDPIESTQKGRRVYLFPLRLRHKRINFLISEEKQKVYLNDEYQYSLYFKDMKTQKVTKGTIDDYTRQPKPKKAPKLVNNVYVYPRSEKTSANALAIAKYQCEYDRSHESFIRKRINIKYTEPHHLVPMSFSSQFDVSLDVEENIVSLCSNCHNCIHYGKDRFKLLEKLFLERKDLLEKVGIKVTFEELKNMYK